jgi:hypothetical protein
VGSSTGASAGRGEATDIDSRGSSSLPEEASASGAGAAGVAGGTVVFTAAGERFTIKLPRFAGSALREARAAAARAAAESGEAREAPAAEGGAGVDAGGGSCGATPLRLPCRRWQPRQRRKTACRLQTTRQTRFRPAAATALQAAAGQTMTGPQRT